ncbi:GPP34 family phosphoprotein [Actinocrispum sp. NPDC049592]|uniref:GOLPH3/VPS74 family protein n=1 Tax=Actinocrispum sp. NPDC049592 TaxID=3154835 RepID=UPI00342CC28B
MGAIVRLGDLSLGESLFFLGNDPFTGKPRIAQPVLDIGLAGAVLADLLFDERIALQRGVVVLTSRYATGNAAADRTLALIMGEMDQHGVRDWVQHLQDKVTASLTLSLAERRMVSPKENRTFLKRTILYPPADLRTASEPRARIRAAVLGRTSCDLPTATLALLGWAIGLDDICEPDLPRRQFGEWTERVKSMIIEPIGTLITAVEAAVAATVYGGNRH